MGVIVYYMLVCFRLGVGVGVGGILVFYLKLSLRLLKFSGLDLLVGFAVFRAWRIYFNFWYSLIVCLIDKF